MPVTHRLARFVVSAYCVLLDSIGFVVYADASDMEGLVSMVRRFLTVRQVAEWLGYHPDHVRRLARQGKLPGRTISGSWRFDSSEIEALLGVKEVDDRSSGRRQVLTIRVPVELHRRLGYYCWREEVTANEYVVRLLEEALHDVRPPEEAKEEEE